MWVLLCGLKDPMNFGAVLRSAYYLGADKVLTSPELPSTPLTPVLSKASAGTLEVFTPEAIYSDLEVRKKWCLSKLFKNEISL